MAKRIKIRSFISDFVSNHPWLKIIALILAIAIWFYVKGEIDKFKY